MRIDPRFLVESGSEIYTGAELLLKGCLETPGGVGLLTGYPGSPVAGFFDACHDIAGLLAEKGVAAKMANNEALSVAMINGAQMVGVKGIAVFKSVGLHVAADALSLGNLAGVPFETGGAVIVSGDDPWSESTQVPADSRFLFEHMRVPVLEPSNSQELKDWVGHAFDLSVHAKLYVGLGVTVMLADGGGTVECRPNQWPAISTKQQVAVDTTKIPVEQTVLLPPRTWKQELTFEDRFKLLLKRCRDLGLNRILYPIERSWRGGRCQRAPIGFVSSGPSFAMLCDALREMGLLGEFPMLKLALSYPVDMGLVDEIGGMCERLVVVEERRSFIEKQIAEHLGLLRQNGGQQNGSAETQLWGKQFPGGRPGIPSTRGLHPSLLIQKLTELLRDTPGMPHELANGRLSEELDTIEKAGRFGMVVPVRTPAYCPGCPHRDSSSALLEIRQKLLDPQYMQTTYGKSPTDLVAHGDTGCYTMMMFEPNKPLMHNYSGMGLGGATGAGADPFITNKQIVFMGDGTFFHSGQVAIANAITQQQDITFIILENRTTAMTGHQPNPTLEEDIMGNKILSHDIERIVRSLIPDAAGPLGMNARETKEVPRARVIRMNPASRDDYKNMLEKVILEDGVKIVIADKECGITFHRRRRRAEQAEKKEVGFVREKTYMNVSEEVCEYCLECTNQTGCPGLKHVETDYGKKMQTDFTACVNDGACARIDACPSFEQVIVTRKRPPRLPDEVVDLQGMPEPPSVMGDVWAKNDVWRCYMAGVGGMGIGVAGDILVRAAHKDGLYVGFIDKKGLAIRNGGVFSQIQLSKHPIAGSPVMPWGKADLLIGVDALEAARACSPTDVLRVASPKFTHAVVNTGKTPTILTLMGRDDFEPEELAGIIKSQCKPGQFFSFNVGDLCERLLDSKLYANIMMLGVAYQLGFIPLSYKSLTLAIRHAVGREFERNYRAFNIGRKIVLRPDLFGVGMRKEVESAEQALERKANILKVSSIWGKKNAEEYKKICRETLTQMPGLDEGSRRDYVIRLFDAVQWGTLKYGRQYASRIVKTYAQDTPERNFAVTRAVIWNLAKVMMIKDEVYVSMLYTSPEKYKRDRRRFNVNPANGDKITYVHLNRPEFVLGGKHVKFHWKSRDWQVRVLRHCRWLRAILPSWHAKEKTFREWYTGLVDACDLHAPHDAQKYSLWLEIFKSPEPVTGFRDVRYPKQEAAMQRVAELRHALENGGSDPRSRMNRTVSLTGQVMGTFRGN
ncbi:MAG TPA: 2-oxoacid:acceptor oxidoreductase family protein [Phycisphaerae bacterium]|nr:2-oxoacid:acceptor oxidoreductase family protein [Phycisphaerae bacterium]